MPADPATIPKLRDMLPEDMEGRDGILAKYDSAADLAKAYRELQQLQRSSGTDFPESPDGYEAPETVKDSPLLAKFREAAGKAKITKKQFSAMVDFLDAAKPEDPTGAWADDLKARWGGKHDENLAVANRMIERLAGAVPGLRESLEKTKASKNPDVLEAMFRLGRQMGNDTPVAGGPGGATMEHLRKLAAEGRKLYASPSTDSIHHADYQSSMNRIWEIKEELRNNGIFDLNDPRVAEKVPRPPSLTDQQSGL